MLLPESDCAMTDSIVCQLCAVYIHCEHAPGRFTQIMLTHIQTRQVPRQAGFAGTAHADQRARFSTSQAVEQRPIISLRNSMGGRRSGMFSHLSRLAGSPALVFLWIPSDRRPKLLRVRQYTNKSARHLKRLGTPTHTSLEKLRKEKRGIPHNQPFDTQEAHVLKRQILALIAR